MWIFKYKPKNLKEFVNQKEALNKFLNWISKWKKGKRPLLFYGPPGTGKTCLIEAYSKEKNLEFIQLNASDWRSKKQIEDLFSQTINTKPLFKDGKIILIDEVDGLAGREDVGGIGAIIEIIKKSNYPIILTANDPFDQKLRALREYTELVYFKKIGVIDIAKKLEDILKKENVKYEKSVLREIAKGSEGDLRSAINDLEVVARDKKEIKMKDLEILGRREREQQIFDALKIIFKSKSATASRISISNVDKDPEEIFWWIENNVPIEYEKKEEIAEAFEKLAKADYFRTLITSRQNWKMLRYMIDLMTAGVTLSKKDVYKKFTKYQYPSNIAILGRTKFERSEEKEKLLKLSEYLHCSTKKIKKEFLPYLKIIFEKKFKD